jgi:hypothetical protein
MDTSILETLLSLYLPDGVDLRRYQHTGGTFTPDATMTPYVGRVEIEIEERNIVPPDIPPGARVISKGFYDPVALYDFPLRDKLAKLIVRRRRWINQTTGESIHLPFSPKHPHAFSSEELIAFLK